MPPDFCLQILTICCEVPMCCFTKPVRFVGDTRIFARMCAGRQRVAYQMRMAADETLAMVLPIPVAKAAGDDAVQWIDLSGYPDFFSDLDRVFPAAFAIGSLSDGAPVARSRRLAVVQVGDFDASYVPTVADFSRLDPRFQMPPGTWQSLPAYRDFGFAVFKLRGHAPGVHGVSLPKTFHPMAFSFPSRRPGALFFPTLHVHDGEVRPEAEFKHALYVQGFAPAGWEVSDESVDEIVDLGRCQGLVLAAPAYRKHLNGTLPNEDVWVEQ